MMESTDRRQLPNQQQRSRQFKNGEMSRQHFKSKSAKRAEQRVNEVKPGVVSKMMTLVPNYKRVIRVATSVLVKYTSTCTIGLNGISVSHPSDDEGLVILDQSCRMNSQVGTAVMRLVPTKKQTAVINQRNFSHSKFEMVYNW